MKMYKKGTVIYDKISGEQGVLNKDYYEGQGNITFDTNWNFNCLRVRREVIISENTICKNFIPKRKVLAYGVALRGDNKDIFNRDYEIIITLDKMNKFHHPENKSIKIEGPCKKEYFYSAKDMSTNRFSFDKHAALVEKWFEKL